MEPFDIILIVLGAVATVLLGAYVLLYVAFLRGLFVPYPRIGYWVGLVTFWPTLPASLLYRRVLRGEPAYSSVDEHVALGGIVLPWSVSALRADGFTHVINMLSEYGGPVAQLRLAGIEQLRLPTIDHTEPSVEQLNEAVRYVDAAVRECGDSARVLVHCRAGHGRSASVAMAWLIAAHGLAPSEAQARLDAIRTVRRSLSQQPTILDFASQHISGI